MTFQSILSRYQPYLEACRDHIVADLTNTDGTAVLAGYFHGGKMVRALLTFVAAAAVGVELGVMVPVASALELMHGAALIHDDIVDETDERRGRPALHQQIGVGPAIILGDYLILHSSTVLHQSCQGFGVQRVLEASSTLTAYAQACCLGELRELMPTRVENLEEEYLTIAQGKTASQFAAAVTLPGILGGSAAEELDALRTYGLNTGIAFQIQDDLLDLEEDAGSLVQPSGSARGKERVALPAIYLERYGSPAAVQEYRQILQAVDRKGERLASLLIKEGIVGRLQVTQTRYLSFAIAALDNLRPSEERAELARLASYAVTRRA